MIERTLKTTDGKIRISIPTTLNEVTLGQMMEMQEKEYLGDLDAISILSGIPKEDLFNVIDINDFGIFGEHILSLSNQIKYLYTSDIIPQKIAFTLGKRKVLVSVMRNLSVEPAGAFLAARDIIADEIGQHIAQYGADNWQDHFQPSLKACCNVLAHYFFCRATAKRYDEYEAEEFCEEIKKLRVTEALPIARHFFSCYPVLSKRKTSFLPRLRRYWKKRQASAPSKNSNT